MPLSTPFFWAEDFQYNYYIIFSLKPVLTLLLASGLSAYIVFYVILGQVYIYHEKQTEYFFILSSFQPISICFHFFSVIYLAFRAKQF